MGDLERAPGDIRDDARMASARDTDLADPTAGLTQAFRGDDVDTPPLRFTDVAAALGIDAEHDPSPRHRRLPQDTGSGIEQEDIEKIFKCDISHLAAESCGTTFTYVDYAAGITCFINGVSGVRISVDCMRMWVVVSTTQTDIRGDE